MKKTGRGLLKLCLCLAISLAAIGVLTQVAPAARVEAATRTGFYTDSNNNTYYYKSDGTKAKGLQVINGSRYLFDKTTGIMQTGFQTYNGYKYYFSKSSGKALTGLFKVGSYKYYGNSKGVLLSGWQEITSGTNAGKYYFDATTRRAKTGVQTINGYKYYFSTSTCKMMTGLITADDYKYYANNKGILLKGIVNITSGTDAGRYYFDTTTRRAVTGFQTVNGYKYYFDPTTCKATKGLFTVDGYRYYGNSNGVLLKGFIDINSGDDAGKYYFDATTRRAVTGFQTIGGYKYYFSQKTCKVLKGLFTVGSYKYYGNSKGILLSGIIDVTSGTNAGRYYFDPTTKRMQTGFQTVNGYKYYFSASTGKVLKGAFVIGGNLYCASDKGVLQTGLYTIDSGSRAGTYLLDKTSYKALTGIQTHVTSAGAEYTYYFNKDTYKRESGLKKIGGKTYYFSPEYYTLQKGLRTIDGATYLFDTTTGEMLYGMQNYTAGTGETYTYYFNETTGKREHGLKTIDGKMYYFSPEFYTLQKGYSIELDGKNYYLHSETGEISKGVFRVGNDEIGYFYKYFDPETATGLGATGLQSVNGELYYIHPVYNYASLGLYYVSDAGDKNGLYYFGTENDTKPGAAIKNKTVEVSGITFTSGTDYKVTYTAGKTSDLVEMFTFGLSKLGYPYGQPGEGLSTESSTYRCNSFAAVCYSFLGEEKFNSLVWADYSDARYPYEQSEICAQAAAAGTGKYSTNIADIEPGDLMFWNNDNCGTAIEECFRHTEDDNGKHIHHVSIYMGQGDDGYHYLIEATEIDGVNAVRMARIKDMNIYSSQEEAGTHFYISAIGNL